MDVHRDLTDAGADHALPKGLPIYSLDGKLVGKTRGQSTATDGIALHRGFISQHDTIIPPQMVQRIEQDAIYLNRNHEEIEDMARGGWSNLGERDLITGAPAGQDVGYVPTFPDGNNAAGSSTTTGLITGLPRDNATAHREEQLAAPPVSQDGVAPQSAAPTMGAPAQHADRALPPEEHHTMREVIIDPDVDEPRG